jgi:hypothetical protein
VSRVPAPWLRSVEESIPRRRRPDAHGSLPERLLVTALLAIVIATVVWLVFFSSGGFGIGSV